MILIGERVLIQRDEPITKVGSIMLHPAYAEIPVTATVLAMGPFKNDPGFTVGSKVMVVPADETKLSGALEGQSIVWGEDILAVVVEG